MCATSRLLRLPRELRDHVIRYVFDDFDQERLDFNRHHNVHEPNVTRPIKSLPPICVVSQQLYDEVTPCFLTRITPISFNVATSCWLRKWLPTLSSGLGFRSIHQLAFRNFHGPEQHKGFELIAHCPNLRHLSVMLGDEYADAGTVPSLAISSLSSSVNAYESLDNIIMMHQLHKLAEISSLQVLEFGFHDWEQPMSHDRARQVKEWLSVKFVAKGMDVNIVCKQMQWGGISAAPDVDEVLMRWYGDRSAADMSDGEDVDDDEEEIDVFGASVTV
jgi:hypothetical protein